MRSAFGATQHARTARVEASNLAAQNVHHKSLRRGIARKKSQRTQALGGSARGQTVGSRRRTAEDARPVNAPRIASTRIQRGNIKSHAKHTGGTEEARRRRSIHSGTSISRHNATRRAPDGGLVRFSTTPDHAPLQSPHHHARNCWPQYDRAATALHPPRAQGRYGTRAGIRRQQQPRGPSAAGPRRTRSTSHHCLHSLGRILSTPTRLQSWPYAPIRARSQVITAPCHLVVVQGHTRAPVPWYSADIT